jgi:hypothetical protein
LYGNKVEEIKEVDEVKDAKSQSPPSERKRNGGISPSATKIA